MTPKSTDCDVLVIGAGISGLTAAFLLSRAGLRVEVIEAASRAGGVIGTDTRDGFLFERGPNSLFDNAPAIGELLAALGIAGERIEVSAGAKKRYIVREGKLVALPLSPPGLIATPLFSAGAKLKLFREPFVARAPDPRETVAAFVTRRLGREFLDYAVEPFVAGIYAGDPTELSVKAAFPRMYALEARYGGLIKGQILGARDRARERGTRGVPKSFSFVNGMQTLPDALARAAGAIRFNTRATRIARADGANTVDIEHAGGAAQLRSRAVVLAVPADRAAALLGSFDPPAAEALNAIPYAPVASVVLGYERGDVAHALDGFGFLVPRLERRQILGCLFSSSMFGGRAPADHVLATVYVGGRRQPELVAKGEAELAAIAHAELDALLGARAIPVFSVVTRWPRAIPQYTLGHLERIDEADAAQRALPGLFLCASWRGGISVGDCIQSAHRVADTVRAYIQH